MQKYLSELTPFQTTDYDLWKATKKLKNPQTSNPSIKTPEGKWARNDKEKAENLALHLFNVFQEWDIPSNRKDIDEIDEFFSTPYQLNLPIKKFKTGEIKKMIRYSINPNKFPGNISKL